MTYICFSVTIPLYRGLTTKRTHIICPLLLKVSCIALLLAAKYSVSNSKEMCSVSLNASCHNLETDTSINAVHMQ